jgi:hypothetical protein
MKTKTLKVAATMGLTALLVGSAAAQESASKPVGYETLTIEDGFNYLGLRLHEAPVASGIITAIDADSIEDSAADFSALTGTYILEIDNGSGIIQEVVAFNSSTEIPTEDLTGAVALDDSYTLRPVATLESVFGADGGDLDPGNAGTGGADQVWIPDGTGGFDKYYYDNTNLTTFVASWTNADGSNAPVDPATISLVYTDGLVIVGAGGSNDFVVTGSVKLTETNFALASGFNYVSSVSPAGSTLASMFGTDNESLLDAGNAGTGGADQVWVPVAGGFDKYYYDNTNLTTFVADWTNADTGAAVVPANVSLDDASGLIIVNPGVAQSNSAGVPSFYGTL